jgi:hypothetical protein
LHYVADVVAIEQKSVVNFVLLAMDAAQVFDLGFLRVSDCAGTGWSMGTATLTCVTLYRFWRHGPASDHKCRHAGPAA